jgi:hypothetical protein
MVMIKLKMGSNHKKPLAGFEGMHNHTGLYDSGKSWEQNFIQIFGVSLINNKINCFNMSNKFLQKGFVESKRVYRATPGFKRNKARSEVRGEIL